MRCGCYENAYEGLRKGLFTGFGGAMIPGFPLPPDAAREPRTVELSPNTPEDLVLGDIFLHAVDLLG